MIAKELTKLHEEIFFENIQNIKNLKKSLKGELTLVVSNRQRNLPKKLVDKNKIINKAKKYLKRYSLKDTVDLIIENEKINKKDVYQICLNIKNEKDN